MPPAEPSLVAAHPDVEPLLDARADAQRARCWRGWCRPSPRRATRRPPSPTPCALARVSRGTFYALFASKEACFLEAYRHGVDVLEDARARGRPRRGRRLARAAARRACAPTCAPLADEPRFARIYLLEIHAAGPRAQAARDAALRRFAGRYRQARSRPRCGRATPGCPPTTRCSSSPPASTSSSARRLREPAATPCRPRGHAGDCAVAPGAALARSPERRRTPDGPDLQRARDGVPRRAARLARRQRPGPASPSTTRTPTTPGAATGSAGSPTAAGPAVHWPAEYGGRGATLTRVGDLLRGARPRRRAAARQRARPPARRPDDHDLGHRRAEGPLPRADPHRRGDLVPGLLASPTPAPTSPR